MGFTTAWIFGSDYSVIENTSDYEEVKYHVITLGKRLWLADEQGNELHEYTDPRVVITRLNDGKRTLTGIDKGRWFVRLSEADKSNLFPPKLLLCKSEKQARNIVDAVEYVRKNLAG